MKFLVNSLIPCLLFSAEVAAAHKSWHGWLFFHISLSFNFNLMDRIINLIQRTHAFISMKWIINLIQCIQPIIILLSIWFLTVLSASRSINSYKLLINLKWFAFNNPFQSVLIVFKCLWFCNYNLIQFVQVILITLISSFAFLKFNIGWYYHIVKFHLFQYVFVNLIIVVLSFHCREYILFI